MICRYCGNKTENLLKCDSCLEEMPFLPEYRSYTLADITEKIMPLLEDSEMPAPEEIPEVPEEVSEIPEEMTFTETPVENHTEIPVMTKTSAPEKLPETPVTVIPEKIPAYVPDGFRRRRNIIMGIVGMACVMGICLFIAKAPDRNSGLTGQLPDETVTTVAKATLPETPFASPDGTYINTSDTDVTTTGTTKTSTGTVTTTRPAPKSAGIPEDNHETSIRGKYYSISDSVFSKSHASDFINIFGTRPVECNEYMYLKDNTMEYNDEDYSFTYEDNTITFEDTDFAGIDEDFLDTFNFNEITQGNNFNNTDGQNNQLYVFRIKKENDVDSVILCNKLDGLYYDDVQRTADFSGEGIDFSISNTGKDSIYLYKDNRIDVSLQTAYRDNAVEIDDGQGEIIIKRYGEKYDIVRISPDGQHYFYFYRKYNDPDVYMIQYVKYNTSAGN